MTSLPSSSTHLTAPICGLSSSASVNWTLTNLARFERRWTTSGQCSASQPIRPSTDGVLMGAALRPTVCIDTNQAMGEGVAASVAPQV